VNFKRPSHSHTRSDSVSLVIGIVFSDSFLDRLGSMPEESV
jgi:hypothetical protein